MLFSNDKTNNELANINNESQNFIKTSGFIKINSQINSQAEINLESSESIKSQAEYFHSLGFEARKNSFII